MGQESDVDDIGGGETHRLAKEGLADESASDLKDSALTMRWPQTIHGERQS